MRYSFSGHESFHCKSLWLKKGYDFICNQKHFTDTDSVVELGVGKNMVSAIRYWLKKVCRNTRCAFFFFIDYKNRLIFLSCDILRISLIYAFATSK